MFDKSSRLKMFFDKQNRKPTFFFVSGFFIFVFLRMYYWNLTFEVPFSDMADFDRIAHGVLNHFSFNHDSFWWTYRYPTLPIMRAVQMLFLGESLWAWQIFMLVCTGVALSFFVVEVVKYTNKKWIGVLLLWSIALSKSSIFWSYKIASENTAEFFLYLTLAMSLYALRKKTNPSFFLLGVVFVASILNRPNMIVQIGFFVIVYILNVGILRNKSNRRSVATSLIFLTLGIIVCWSPWVIRSIMLYGKPVLISTSSPFSSIYGIWNIDYKDKDGNIVSTTYTQLLSEAPKKFPNDYVAANDASKIYFSWLKENWTKLPILVVERLARGVITRDIQLTTVSRTEMFSSFLDKILLDKSLFLVVFSIIGFVFISVLYPCLSLVGLYGFFSWSLTGLVQFNPRMFEPTLPVFLFSALFVFVYIGLWLIRQCRQFMFGTIKEV